MGNTCAAYRNGRIIVFSNVSLLAGYLDMSPETLNRHRRELRNVNGVRTKYYGNVLVDFEPNIINNKK